MLNDVNFIGRLTKDVDGRKIVKADKSESLVASFDLAIDGAKRKDGTKDVTFIQCKVLNDAQAGNIIKYLHKGSLVAVSGQLHQYHFTAEDVTTRSGYEVIAREVTFLDPKPKAENEQAEKEAASKDAGL